MKFHVLGLPHTVTTPEYSSCAFTTKVVKLCKMLKLEGHEVIHYGGEGSMVECDEHVNVVDAGVLEKSYPGHDWRKSGFPPFAMTDLCYTVFTINAVAEIATRKQPGDFLLCPFGLAHEPVAKHFPDLIVVESGIGYPHGTFAPFRIFESYAIMHAYQGADAAKVESNNHWYDHVIPNSFDLGEFEYSDKKLGYFLFLGRLSSAKGLHIAKQVASAAKLDLVIAGPGNDPDMRNIGVVNPAMRKLLLRDAKAVLCPSTFLEPFCGVQIEAMLSGTPVISSDRGAFAEYNRHVETGYRCRTLEQFVWAAKNISKIDPTECRMWGQRFSLEMIAPMYTDYFKSLQDLYDPQDLRGWGRLRDRKTLSFSSF